MADSTRNESSGMNAETEVPRNEWESFLNSFSKKHENWIATVEVTGARGEREVEVRQRSFSGISYNEPDTGETRITIGISDEDPANNIDHSAINPTRVALLGDNRDDIKVTSADGSLTVVRFIQEPSEAAA